MPSFGTISNGESGLSVRTKLNNVINYVNTGITSGTSYTYITEDTTPGSEFVNILSPRDVYISGGTSVEIEYYGSPSITSYLYMDNTETELHTDNGTNSSTQTLTTNDMTSLVTDGDNITQLQMYCDGGLDIQFNDSNISDTYNGYVSMTSEIVDISLTDISSQITDTLLLNPSNSMNGGGLSSTDGIVSSSYKFRPDSLLLTTTDGSYTSGLETINEYGRLHSGQGIYSSEVKVNGDATILTTSTDGTDTSTLELTPDTITSLVDKSVVLYSGTSNAYPFLFDEVKGVLTINIPDDDVASSGYFNISNNVLIYFTGDSQYYYSIDINGITTLAPSIGNPNGVTRLALPGSQGISNTYVGQYGYVITPTLGGGGTNTIPQSIATDTTEISISDSRILHQIVDGVLNTTLDLDAVNGTSLLVSDGTTNIELGLDGSTGIGSFSSEGGIYTSSFTLDPDSVNTGTRLATYDTSTLYGTSVQLDGDILYLTASQTPTNYSENQISGSHQIFSTYWEGTRQVDFVIDASTGGTGTYISSVAGDITDTFVISPDSNVNNTKLRSEDTNTGAYSELIMVYDNPDWTCSDGGTNGSSLTFTPSNPIFTSTDGTWTSTLELDPTENANQTGLETTDGTNTNMIRVNQGGVTITTADGVNSVDLSFTSTNLLLTGIPSFDDDAAASGLTAGSIYQTTGGGASPLDVAGILMIKQ